jgi:hypothetical protein
MTLNAGDLEHRGGGWYLLPDGRKIHGYAKAAEAAGLPTTKPTKTSGQVVADKAAKTAEVEERRAEIASLLVRKTPYRQIARKLNVSLGTVASDVEAIRTAWREDALSNLADHVVEELNALDHDEHTLREELATLTNLDDNSDRIVDTARGPRTYGSFNLIEEKMKVYDRILRIRERRAKLLGLDAPIVQRILSAQDPATETERVVFRAGGSEEDFLSTLKAAQGQADRKLRVVQ